MKEKHTFTKHLEEFVKLHAMYTATREAFKGLTNPTSGPGWYCVAIDSDTGLNFGLFSLHYADILDKDGTGKEHIERITQSILSIINARMFNLEARMDVLLPGWRDLEKGADVKEPDSH